MSNISTHKAMDRAFNERDWETVKKLLHPDCAFTDQPRAHTSKGIQEAVADMQNWVRGFSDARAEQIRYIDGGATTVALFQGRGINDGPLGEQQPATNKRMDVAFCEVMHYDEAGKVTGGELYYDALTQLIQLGLAQPPTMG
ncbi:nuclear transport factor 2 family protein [Streptomyces sp. NBC_01304]|uniref:nuclear transport factor 2 family protein n=1 Tax=Streptomyces sp. NBC_01304 TaxID=2903818 RepID=UPI002E0FE9F0|nr:ester cyclase [Streptomyces sp. NBC_01304]